MSQTVRTYKRYPAYKDSGVEWLSEVPEHWRMLRLSSTVSDCQNGLWGDEPDGIHDVATVRVADFDRGRFRVTDIPTLRAIDGRLVASRALKRGDLLLEKSGGGENQPVGAVVLYDLEQVAVCSNFIARMPVSPGFDPRFLTYVHATLYAFRVNTKSVKQNTGIQNLDSSSYLSEPAAFAAFEEQRAISAFLDRETGKIDALVAKKERLIELLQENRSALIARAVTKGLYSDVSTKESHIESVGRIPAHWAVKRLKHLALGKDAGIQMGPFGSMLKALSHSDTGFKLYGQENTISGDFGSGSRWITPAQYRELREYAIREEDVLVTRKGSIGNARLVPANVSAGIIDSDTIRIRLDREFLNPRFVTLLLHDAHYVHEQITAARRGAVLGGLNTSSISDLVVAVPPLEEQGQMLRFLDRKELLFERLISRVRVAVNKAYELRTALISAAVTGKIDVREGVA